MEQLARVKNEIVATETRFKRTELKYLIPNRIVDIIIPDLLTHMQPDRFSQNGFYSIYSVYFDTHDWQAYYSKMDGNAHRQKLRIRSYFDKPEPDEPVFLEVKEKFDYLITKRREPLQMNQVQGLLDGLPSPESNDVYDEWRYNIIRNSLKPRLLNSYDRYAFESPHHPGLRVTIDRNISFAATDVVDFTLPTHQVYWGGEYSVLEVKFAEYAPQFIVDLLRRNNFSKEAISKYCYSVITNYLVL